MIHAIGVQIIYNYECYVRCRSILIKSGASDLEKPSFHNHNHKKGVPTYSSRQFSFSIHYVLLKALKNGLLKKSKGNEQHSWKSGLSKQSHLSVHLLAFSQGFQSSLLA